MLIISVLLVAKYICLVKDVFQSSLNHDKPSLDALNKMHNYFLCECVHIKYMLFNDVMRYIFKQKQLNNYFTPYYFYY